MLKRFHAHLVVAMAALTITSPTLGHGQDASNPDRVTVTSGGEYVSYPPMRTIVRGNGVTEYTIDMATAIVDRLTPTADRAVSMTWARTDSKHTICFRHQDTLRCRDLDLPVNTAASPRFKPTLIDRWPSIYVRFSDMAGKPVYVLYSGGEIVTLEEQMDQMRTARPARQN